MNYFYYDKFIDKKTTGRRDLTPIFYNAKIFKKLINDMSKPFKEQKIDKIVAIDAMGFVLGSAMALKLKTGLVTARKGGKLPGFELLKEKFTDYSGKEKELVINKNSINRGDKILIVDDWIETGNQMKITIKLIEEQKGEIIGISCFAIEKKKETEIFLNKYNAHGIGIFEGEELKRIKDQIGHN